MKRYLTFLLSIILIFSLKEYSVFAESSVTDIMNVTMNLEDINYKVIDDNSVQYEETYSTVIEMEDDIDSSINTFSSLENEENNVFWKATVKIVYTISGEYVQLTKVTGSWVQLRGATTLSNRRVYYGQSYLASNSATGSKKPSKNSFSYSTGFKKGRYIYNKSVIGANTTATITLSGGSKRTIEARADKNL